MPAVDTACISFDGYPDARAVIVRIADTDPARLLKSDGQPNASKVVCAALERWHRRDSALAKLRGEVASLTEKLDAAQIKEGGYCDTIDNIARERNDAQQALIDARAELAALRGITKAPTDADRLAAAMARAGLTRPILAAQVGCHVDTIRNVAKRGFKLTGDLAAWVVAREAEVVR